MHAVEEPIDIYPVFKPAPGSKETWKWDDSGREQVYPENPDAGMPLWNPKVSVLVSCRLFCHGSYNQHATKR